ncbi:MAG TPA: hypothetical protein VFQ68_23080 [Streptosporangiaceae bacterium]|nr:hypothetical protein [Streptosporangiaceae bacterium]
MGQITIRNLSVDLPAFDPDTELDRVSSLVPRGPGEADLLADERAQGAQERAGRGEKEGLRG